MTPEPKSPTAPAPAVDAKGANPRRHYVAPRLKCLGSVRELTLGSPLGLLMDLGAKRPM